MQLKLKSSDVNLDGLTIEIIQAIIEAMAVWRWQGMDTLTITSARDGKHKVGSKHYQGDAIDLRIWSLPNALDARDDLQRNLGDYYDVILEKDHIHIEFDPPHTDA